MTKILKHERLYVKFLNNPDHSVYPLGEILDGEFIGIRYFDDKQIYILNSPNKYNEISKEGMLEILTDRFQMGRFDSKNWIVEDFAIQQAGHEFNHEVLRFLEVYEERKF